MPFQPLPAPATGPVPLFYKLQIRSTCMSGTPGTILGGSLLAGLCAAARRRAAVGSAFLARAEGWTAPPPRADHAVHGNMVEYYAPGRLQSRSVVSNGLLHGLSEGWHTNGVR